MPDNNSEKAIIIFDGVCILCNHFAQFLIKHDKQHRFKFATLQSEVAKSLLINFIENPENLPDSVILIENNQVYIKSDAALKIVAQIDGPLKHLSFAKYFPLWLRDPAYDFIAKNRYSWFGKKNNCMVPSPEIKSRFL